jgi:hypothetical protein
MLWTVYLRNGTAFVPTVAQTDAGFFLNIDPVGVVAATDSEALRQAIEQALARGNPKIPTPTRATFPKPVLLKYAKTKSWSAFEKTCLNWTIVEKDGVYQVKQGRKRPDRGWEDDPARIEVLPPGTGIGQVAQRVTFSVQNALETSDRSRPK